MKIVATTVLLIIVVCFAVINAQTTTCPPVPSNCPCGVVLPAGSTCKRCKINCPTATTTKASTTTTTKAATTTTKTPTSAPTSLTVKPQDTPSCWTCPAGYMHWYDAGSGYSSPPGGDQCACVPLSSTTTTTTKSPSTPSSTPSCWTCPAGYMHWYDSGSGFSSPPGGDQCACVPSSGTTTTKAATTTTTTTTTAAPGTTRPNCWTCPANYAHWWDFGYDSPPSGDQCQCIQGVPGQSTTSPSSSPTSAPTNSLQKLLNLMTPSSSTPGSISFSPYVAPYSPWNGPPMSLIDNLGSIIAKQTNFRTVLIYYTEPYLVGSLVRNAMNIVGIISLNGDSNNNAYVIQTAIDTYKKYPNNVVGLVRGNEQGLQQGVTSNTAAIINNCLARVKAANLGIPVGVMDTYSSWTNNGPWTAVAQNAQFIGVNAYAFWDNVYIPPPFTCETPVNGPQIVYNNYMKVQAMYPQVPVILTESGWPTCSTGYSCTYPNVHGGGSCTSGNSANQKQYVQNLVNIFRANKKPLNVFEAFSESWKGTDNSDVNRWWGVCSGSSPYSCGNAPV